MIKLRLPFLITPLLVLALATACSDDDPVDDPDVGVGDDVTIGDDVDDAPDTGTDPDTGDDPDTGEEPEDPLDYPLADCDGLVPQGCALPWPSNLYLAPDSDRATGYQLTFGDTSLPATIGGVHIAQENFEQFDGFDLGVPIMAIFENLDDEDLPHEYEIEDSMADDAKILLYQVDGDSLTRVPYFAELDRLQEDSEERVLFVRPAVILEMSTRYVVAFRDLVDTDGDPIPASDDFQALVDGDTDDDPVLTHRQGRFEEIFDLLATDGVDRDDLVLAWDFVTASSEALHGQMLHIQDDATAFADEHGISWTVDELELFSDDPNDANHHPHIAARVQAIMEVPHYMEPYEPVEEGWKFHRDEDGQITQNGTREVPVLVRIPHQAADGDPTGMIVFGHGLLGNRFSMESSLLDGMANDLGYVLAAVDLVGMSSQEEIPVFQAVLNMNYFTAITDRLHQGMLEYLLLARTAPDGLATLDLEGISVDVDPDDVHYFGASQGGIFGATFMALTPDVRRGLLAVPGNNYSTLLQRSTNFDIFDDAMAATYPSVTDRILNIAAMGLLWGTTEPVSYLRHIRAEPFDGQANDVYLAVAKGDYQVATITNEIVARSGIEIPLLENYDAQREPYGVEIATYPHDGSGTILFDFGNPWPAPGNLPPDDEVGDPHGWIGSIEEVVTQVDTFYRDGIITDICGGEPCQFPAP